LNFWPLLSLVVNAAASLFSSSRVAGVRKID
jgi:hypothetical protein